MSIEAPSAAISGVNIFQLTNLFNQVIESQSKSETVAAKLNICNAGNELAPQKPKVAAVLLLNIPGIAVVPTKWAWQVAFSFHFVSSFFRG